MPNGRLNDLIIIRLLSQQIRSVKQNLTPPSQISQNKTNKEIKNTSPPQQTKNRKKKIRNINPQNSRDKLLDKTKPNPEPMPFMTSCASAALCGSAGAQGLGACGRDLSCTPLGCDYLAVLTRFEIITRNSSRPRNARGRMSNLFYLQDQDQVSSLTVYVYSSPLKLVAASKAIKLRTVCRYIWVGAVSTHIERLFLVYCSNAPLSRAGNRFFYCQWMHLGGGSKKIMCLITNSRNFGLLFQKNKIKWHLWLFLAIFSFHRCS